MNKAVKIKKGLDLRLEGIARTGMPEEGDAIADQVKHVAVLGRNFHNLKPSMAVAVGDKVKLGQTLFSDKGHPEIQFTAPGGGSVVAIHRGAKRSLQSVVIELDEGGAEAEPSVAFDAYSSEQMAELGDAEIRQQMLASGLWTSLRTRPFNKVPAPDHQPAGIFVTAMDTNPMRNEPAPIIAHYQQAYLDGLTLLTALTKGKVYVCTHPDNELPQANNEQIETHYFEGKHPACLPGTHIHHILPVNEHRSVWHLHYQDVIALGKTFATGRLFVERMVAFSGPMVKDPRIIKTRIGASTNELVAGQLHDGDARVVSGPLLSGVRAAGNTAFLSRFSLHLVVIPEGQPRQFLHWVNPFLRQFSVLNVFFARFSASKPLRLTSSQNGSPRAMVPLGSYEAVMPLDILPTQLLRALLVRDTESAKKLGCLELAEDDLALCTFVCHSKYEYGPALRACLDIIEREG